MASGRQHPLVLVVDDEPALRLLCRVNLELAGFQVAEAATLAEARERLERGDVAAVLLDLRVGSEDGHELLDELAGSEVPVAVVTGSSEVAGGEDARADAVLTKPFTIDALVGVVRSLTGDHQRTR